MSPWTDRTRMLRGALSGAVAASVWAAQQPLDRRVFTSQFDDVELLGRAVTRGAHWRAPGLVMHVANGAAFGAVYSAAAPSLPLPAPLRGPAAALVEHLATWPLTMLTDRLHPARDQLPTLSGNRSAFLQATWRHLLFGLVLGELERRLNPPVPDPDPEPPVPPFSTNGHGSLEHALSVEPDA